MTDTARTRRPPLEPWAEAAFTGKDFPLTVRLTLTYFSVTSSNSLSFNYFQGFCLFVSLVPLLRPYLAAFADLNLNKKLNPLCLAFLKFPI